MTRIARNIPTSLFTGSLFSGARAKRIAAGESVRQITTDKKVGLSERGFYKMMQVGDEALVQRYAHAREIQADRMPP